MPKGKAFCPFESAFFPVEEFRMVDGTRVHSAEPLHRATDGVLVEIRDGSVSVIDTALAEVLDAMEQE